MVRRLFRPPFSRRLCACVLCCAADRLHCAARGACNVFPGRPSVGGNVSRSLWEEHQTWPLPMAPPSGRGLIFFIFLFAPSFWPRAAAPTVGQPPTHGRDACTVETRAGPAAFSPCLDLRAGTLFPAPCLACVRLRLRHSFGVDLSCVQWLACPGLSRVRALRRRWKAQRYRTSPLRRFSALPLTDAHGPHGWHCHDQRRQCHPA